MKKYFFDVIRHKYIDFGGRASRKEFWLFHLFCALTIFVLSMLFFSLYYLVGEEGGFLAFLVSLLGFATGLINLGLFIPIIALSVRRLHDAGLTGWLVLLSFFFAPINIIFGLIPPTPGANRYDL